MRYNRGFLIAWILLALIAIKKLFQMYYFPSEAMVMISEEFLPYSFIIEIAMVLICLSLIPGVYVLKKAYDESEYIIGDFFIFILMLSAIPVAFTLLSTYLLNNIFFPLGLLLYGILFSVLSYYKI